MREIKFQFLYKGLPFHSGTEDCNWHKKVYSLDQLIEKKLSDLSDVHGISTLIAKRQFTGIANNNGDELYEGDVIDIQGHIATICCENSYREFYFWNEICNEYMGLAFLIGYKSFKIIGNIYENPDLIGDL